MAKIFQVYLGGQADELRPRLQQLADHYAGGSLGALVRALADGQLLPAMLAAPLSADVLAEESADGFGPLLPVLLGDDDEFAARQKALKTLAALFGGGSISALVRALATGQLLERMQGERATVDGE